VGFGVGFGVGWFPLGFGEPFHPWYHAGFGYVNNINIHNTVIRNAGVLNGAHNFNYAYAHNANAVTAASRSSFTNGERINRGSSRVSAASLNGAHVTNGAGFAPTKSSYLGAGHTGAGVATPPSSVQNRSVVARNTPAVGASGQAHSATAGGFNANTARQNQVAQSRPSTTNNATRYSSNGRSWSAQGNVTDRGTAPQGAGRNAPANGSVQTAHNLQSDRPDWARAGAQGASNNGARNNTATRNNVGSATNGNRAPSTANRSYQPQRNYSAPTRNYSAPTRTNSAPSHAASAPSHSSGGGASHASGGGSHGGGGSHH